MQTPKNFEHSGSKIVYNTILKRDDMAPLAIAISKTCEMYVLFQETGPEKRFGIVGYSPTEDEKIFGLGEIINPSANIQITKEGEIVVLDKTKKVLLFFNKEGKLVSNLGQRWFKSPVAFAYGESDEWFIVADSDPEKPQLILFNKRMVLKKFDRPIESLEKFKNIKDVAFSRGVAYTTDDSGIYKTVMYGYSHEKISGSDITSIAMGKGTDSTPANIVIIKNGEVVIYRSVRDFMGRAQWNPTKYSAKLSSPRSMTVDDLGRVFIADYEARCIVYISSEEIEKPPTPPPKIKKDIDNVSSVEGFLDYLLGVAEMQENVDGEKIWGPAASIVQAFRKELNKTQFSRFENVMKDVVGQQKAFEYFNNLVDEVKPPNYILKDGSRKAKVFLSSWDITHIRKYLKKFAIPVESHSYEVTSIPAFYDSLLAKLEQDIYDYKTAKAWKSGFRMALENTVEVCMMFAYFFSATQQKKFLRLIAEKRQLTGEDQKPFKISKLVTHGHSLTLKDDKNTVTVYAKEKTDLPTGYVKKFSEQQ